MTDHKTMTPEEKEKVHQLPILSPKHTKKKEDALDEALDESFPASDPVAISITPPPNKI